MIDIQIKQKENLVELIEIFPTLRVEDRKWIIEMARRLAEAKRKNTK